MTQLPDIHVDSVRKILDDGNHNGFTDMCRFGGEIYLAFRSCPDGHGIFPTSKIVVLASRDGAEWEPVHSFGVPFRDVRDPHFLVFRDTLFVYTGTWLCDPEKRGASDMNDHLGYAVWSRDGRTWSEPRSLEGTYGHYIWRAASDGDKAYLCGRRVRDFTPTTGPAGASVVMQSALLESNDGLLWKWAGFFHETCGSETAFLFEDDGAILAVVRARGQIPDAQLCRAKPPYRQWSRTGLGRNIGGPLLAKWGRHYLVGGRKWLSKSNPKTVLSWLVDDQLVDQVELPSGGDNSYPGFVPLSNTRGLLSYYSSHEGSGSTAAPCAVYLTELSL